LNLLKAAGCLLLIVAGQSCLAGIYKCPVNGKTVYQDAPCDAAQPQAGKIKVTTPVLGNAAPASATSQEQATDTPRPSATGGVTPPPTAPSRANSMSSSLDSLTASEAIGMSAESALQRFGQPRKINRSTTASGVREQWVYADGQYVYVENGRVTAIQQSGRPGR
jgi:hypothetical protein